MMMSSLLSPIKAACVLTVGGNSLAPGLAPRWRADEADSGNRSHNSIASGSTVATSLPFGAAHDARM